MLLTINNIVLIQGGFMDLLRIICAIFIPPLGVFLKIGLGIHFWINIILTLLGYFPGLIHAIWVLIKE